MLRISANSTQIESSLHGTKPSNPASGIRLSTHTTMHASNRPDVAPGPQSICSGVYDHAWQQAPGSPAVCLPLPHSDMSAYDRL